MQSAFYEWKDPNTGLGNGAYPFKTGISALRMAVSEIIQNENSQLSSKAYPHALIRLELLE